MNGKRLTVLILGMAIIFLTVGVLIPRETTPSDSTRVILEHHEQTYIAPICFEDANATNFLEESTLIRAIELNYDMHSNCTKEALASEQDPFIISLLKELGILRKPWDSW